MDKAISMICTVRPNFLKSTPDGWCLDSSEASKLKWAGPVDLSCKISNKVNTKTLLFKVNMLSIRQMNAQTKLLEIWKASNVTDYPINTTKKSIKEDQVATRACTNGKLIELGHKTQSQKKLSWIMQLRSGILLQVASCTSIRAAKIEIKKYVKSLPVWFK